MPIIQTKYGELIIDEDVKGLLDGKRISINGPYFNIAIADLVAPPKPTEGLVLDHINGNKNDNRRENLRWISRQHNSLNRVKQGSTTSSVYKGVNFFKSGKKWRMRVMYKGRPLCDALFLNEVDAAEAFDVCIEHFYPGVVKQKNFPDKVYDQKTIDLYLSLSVPTKIGTGTRGVTKRGNKFVADFTLFGIKYNKEFDTIQGASDYVKHIEKTTPHSEPSGLRIPIVRSDGVVYKSVAECASLNSIPRSLLYSKIKAYGAFEYKNYLYKYADK